MNIPVNAIPSLLVYGPLGIFSVLLIFAVWFLYRQNTDLQNKRIEDAKQISSTVTEPLAKINNTLVNYNMTLSAMLTLLQKLSGEKV